MIKIKRILSITGTLSFMTVFGIVGGIEQDFITLQRGTMLCSIFLAIVGISMYMFNIVDREFRHNREIIRKVQNDYCNYIVNK